MNEKNENELNTYFIPLNYKLDASLFGIEIKWKRVGESVLIGLIAFFCISYLFTTIGFFGFKSLIVEFSATVILFLVSMNGIKGVSLLEYFRRMLHFRQIKKMYGEPDEKYLEEYEKELEKERQKKIKLAEKELKQKKNYSEQGMDIGDLTPRELKQAAKLEKKRKKQEEQIKRKMIKAGEDPVKVAAMQIPLEKKEKKEYPMDRVIKKITSNIQEMKDNKITKKQEKIIDSYEIPAPFSTTVDISSVIAIRNGVIVTTDNTYIKILEITPLHFDLKSNREKNMIIADFLKYIRIAPKIMHIKTMNTKADLSEMLKDAEAVLEKETNKNCKEMQKKEIKYLRSVISSSVSHRYFMIFSVKEKGDSIKQEVDAMNQLYTAYSDCVSKMRENGMEIYEPDENHSENQLYYLYTVLQKDRIGKKSYNDHKLDVAKKYLKAIKSQELLDKLPISSFFMPDEIDCSNSKYVVVDGMYRSYFYVDADGYPTNVLAGWITHFTNANDMVDVDIYAKQENKDIVRGQIKYTLGNNENSLNNLKTNDTSYDARVKSYESAMYIKSSLASENLYNVVIVITLNAYSKDEILELRKNFEKEIRSEEMRVRAMDFIQDIGYQMSMPTGKIDDRWIYDNARRNVMSSGLASFFPFISNEIADKSGILLGTNSIDGSLMIYNLFDRSKYENANIMVFGGSGSGKTYLSQILATRFRKKRIPIYVLTALKGFEWKRACDALGGVFLELSETSTTHINIMDITLRDDRADELIDGTTEPKSALIAKITSLKDFFSLLVPNLEAQEKDNMLSDLDNVLLNVYTAKGITKDNASVLNPDGSYKTMPLLEDVYEEGSKTEYTYMKPLLQQLHKFVYGSCKVFNNYTNVDLDNLYTVLDVSNCSKDLLSIVMYIATDFVLSRSKEDRMQNKIILFEEIWRLIKQNVTVASYVDEMFRTIRGYGGGVIGVTQDIQELNRLDDGRFAESILANSCMKITMKVSDNAAKITKNLFNLTETEYQKVLRFHRGQAMLIANHNNVVVDVTASEEEDMLITTDADKLRKLYGDHKKIERVAG